MPKLIRGLINIPAGFHGCAVTIGNFDGIHLAHQAIIKQLIVKSKQLKLPSLLIIFEPQPNEFFAAKEFIPARLTRFREKWLALQTSSLDYLLCLHFNQKLADLSAQSFIDEILVQHLKVKCILVGDDFRFGRQRCGDINTLKTAGKKSGFTAESLPAYHVDGFRVSSSLIRLALKSGELQKAQLLLGRKYDIVGRISYGNKRGRTIGIPTANIFLHRQETPLKGVYAVKIRGLFKTELSGVANIGTRPTVDGTKNLLEVHIFNFDEDIYGKYIYVEFARKIRDEKRYASFELLREQIFKDVAEAKEYFAQLQI